MTSVVIGTKRAVYIYLCVAVTINKTSHAAIVRSAGFGTAVERIDGNPTDRLAERYRAQSGEIENHSALFYRNCGRVKKRGPLSPVPLRYINWICFLNGVSGVCNALSLICKLLRARSPIGIASQKYEMIESGFASGI